jgi:hypothetical protein
MIKKKTILERWEISEEESKAALISGRIGFDFRTGIFGFFG